MAITEVTEKTNDSRVRLVIGPPGCGKTSHVVACAQISAQKFGRDRVLLASLTKAAAAEISGRRLDLPRDAVGTLHSHAFRALSSPQIVQKEHILAWNEAVGGAWAIDPEYFSRNMERSDGAHGKYGTQYHGTQILEDTTCWRALLLVRDHWPNQNAVDFDRNWSAWKDENALFDFEDLIERATTDCFRAPGNPAVIYLDEAQDSSPAELRLAQIWGEMAGALVCVGDPDQAIYSWRGADPDSFLAMTTPEHRRVLSQSYRVPREVHRVATDWIGRMYGREPIEYYPRVDERGETVRGKVRREPYTNKYPDMIVQEAQIAAESGRTVMVLASCDYMLCTLIRRLRDRGVPYHNPYRVKRGDWNPLRGAGRLLDYLAPSREAWGDAAQPWTWDRLWSWIEVVDARLLKRLAKMQIKTMAAGEDTAARPIADTIRGALARLEREVAADGVSLWDGTPGVLRSLLLASRANQMEYSIRVAENRGVAALRERPQIVVGTIHSVKGGEADVVYLLPDISPSAAAEMERSPDGLRAHLRLFYVAMTRAREELVLCSAASRHAAWR